MFDCENCDRGFKSKQGLNGHRRLKHRADVSVGTVPASGVSLADLKATLDRQEGALAVAIDSMDQVLAGSDEGGLITRIAEAVESKVSEICDRFLDERLAHHGNHGTGKLRQRNGLDDPHHLCDDMNCHHCQTALQNYAAELVAFFHHNLPGFSELHARWLASGAIIADDLDDGALRVVDDNGNELFRIVDDDHSPINGEQFVSALANGVAEGLRQRNANLLKRLAR